MGGRGTEAPFLVDCFTARVNSYRSEARWVTGRRGTPRVAAAGRTRTSLPTQARSGNPALCNKRKEWPATWEISRPYAHRTAKEWSTAKHFRNSGICVNTCGLSTHSVKVDNRDDLRGDSCNQFYVCGAEGRLRRATSRLQFTCLRRRWECVRGRNRRRTGSAFVRSAPYHWRWACRRKAR